MKSLKPMLWTPALVAMAMLAAAALAGAAKPRVLDPAERRSVHLEQVVPTVFGAWRVDESVVPVTISPEVKASLQKIYSETLSRTYIDTSGRRVMLSVAYGDTQSKNLQVHRPEVCYAAQGFQIAKLAKASLTADGLQIPVMRLVSTLGARTEPVTYWVRFGDRIVRGNVEQGIARLSYGLKGSIADGLLFRVSTIGGDEASQYSLQEKFVSDLLAALTREQRVLLVGSENSNL